MKINQLTNCTQHLPSTKPKRKILLVHGLISSSIIWNKLIPYFKKEYEIITYDLYGRGNSNCPDKPLTMTEFANQLESVINKFHIGHNDVIISISWGCGVVAKYLTYDNAIAPYQVIFLSAGGLKLKQSILLYFFKLPLIPILLLRCFKKPFLVNDFKSLFFSDENYDFFELQLNDISQNKKAISAFVNSVKNCPIYFHEIYKKAFLKPIKYHVI